MELTGKEISFFGMGGTTVCKQLVEKGLKPEEISDESIALISLN